MIMRPEAGVCRQEREQRQRRAEVNEFVMKCGRWRVRDRREMLRFGIVRLRRAWEGGTKDIYK